MLPPDLKRERYNQLHRMISPLLGQCQVWFVLICGWLQLNKERVHEEWFIASISSYLHLKWKKYVVRDQSSLNLWENIRDQNIIVGKHWRQNQNKKILWIKMKIWVNIRDQNGVWPYYYCQNKHKSKKAEAPFQKNKKAEGGNEWA